jgi:hypothetical protein
MIFGLTVIDTVFICVLDNVRCLFDSACRFIPPTAISLLRLSEMQSNDNFNFPISV